MEAVDRKHRREVCDFIGISSRQRITEHADMRWLDMEAARFSKRVLRSGTLLTVEFCYFTSDAGARPGTAAGPDAALRSAN